MKQILASLLGQRINLLLTNGQNYGGVLEALYEDCLTLNLNNPDFFLKRIHIRHEMVSSIWEYNQDHKNVNEQERAKLIEKVLQKTNGTAKETVKA